MYQTVYEIRALPSLAFWACLLFILMGSGAILIALRGRKRSGFYLLWGVFAVGVGGLGVVTTSVQHVRAYRAYRNHDVDVLEGPVQVLRRQPAAGHADGDLVEVQGRSVEVNYFSAGPGCKDTLAHGGVLDDGVEVRILAHEGRILRLDLRRPK